MLSDMNKKPVTILWDGEESQQQEMEVKEDKASVLNVPPKTKNNNDSACHTSSYFATHARVPSTLYARASNKTQISTILYQKTQ